jgi:hypothetical protein
MATVTHIGVLFAAQLTAVLMAGVGFVCGVLYSGIGFFIDLFGPGLNTGTALAFMALIGMPVMFAAFGFVAGAIGALVYNVVAGWLGGIKLEMDFTQ